MRRAVRTLGTLLILAGVVMLAWAFVVWRWEDPFTSLYTAYKQRGLESAYEAQLAAFAVPRPTSTDAPAARISPRALARQARRYRKSLERGAAVGRLRIPRLGLSVIVVNGTDAEVLKRGPGRYPGSFVPGEGQLVYVAGHRTTYGAPFARINELRPGDRVTLELPYATFVYTIRRHRIVPATALWVLRSRGEELLALQACHPRFFATERYIAYAAPVRVLPRGGGTYTGARLAARNGNRR